MLDKIQRLKTNIEILDEIKQTIYTQEVQPDIKIEWEIRYGLLESIQIVIDISCKISSRYNLGNPKSYKECIELLSKYKYLEKNIADKLIKMIGLRNLLVHEYVEIDKDKLLSFLDKLDDFYNFIDKVKQYL